MASGTIAQPHWKALGQGTVNYLEVQTLFGDSVSDRLLAGGTFLRIINDTDTVLAVGQAAWNGTRWDSIAHRIQPISGNSTMQTYWFQRFQGGLYSCGNYKFQTESGEWNKSFARLNEAEQRWEALECINPSSSYLDQLVKKTPGAQHLYATGYRSSGLCGYPVACVHRYEDGAFHVWEPWTQIPEYESNYVGYVFEFQDMTYVTGVFRDPHSSGFLTFARVNNGLWEPVPGWGNAHHIRDVLIRDNVLYVCGTFKQSNGAPGNLVASFDGSSWSDLNGGLTLQAMAGGSTAKRMAWHDGHLYVAGVFDHAGGLQLNGGLAVWNGTQWSGFPGAFRTPHPADPDIAMLRDLAIWRDSLFVCGYFDQIDGLPALQVAQYLGELPQAATGVNEAALRPVALRCYPIDGTAWMVELPDEQEWQLSVVNAIGQSIIREHAAKGRALIDLSRASGGLLVVRAESRECRLFAKVARP